ncbi:hypothetical protein ABZ946_10260 [Streptomyces sp. NPDC046324]
MSLFPALIVVAIVLGIIGAVADGLLVADLVHLALRTRSSARHRPVR